MRAASLTAKGRGATSQTMQRLETGRRARMRSGLVILPFAMLAGCISVEAPDGPIVIELNINIKSELLVALADDSVETIEENADIF